MLQYQLEALSEAGLRECIIVVGHRADQVRERFGARFRGLAITYVENVLFDRTNNIYSLWLARHELTDDLLLLEGDLIFEPRLLMDLLYAPYENAAMVDRYRHFMNGTVILAHGDRANAMVLKRDQAPGFDYGPALKTVNIYKFSRRAVRDELMSTLGDYVAQGFTDRYYEMAISRAISEGTLALHVVPTAQRAWAEVDTQEDLADVEAMRFWPALTMDTAGSAPLARLRGR